MLLSFQKNWFKEDEILFGMHSALNFENLNLKFKK